MATQSVSLVVDEELSSFVEAANYEVNSRLDVISYMLSNNMSTGTDAFRSYQAELVEYKKKYELAKAEFERKVVTPYLDEHGIPKANWNLDFTSHTVTLEYEATGKPGGPHICNNGEKCHCNEA